MRSLVLLNTGSLPFDYVWSMGSNHRVTVSPAGGTVGKVGV